MRDRSTVRYILLPNPPYHGSEGDDGKGLFRCHDFAELAEILAALKSRFLLSINDHPEIRQTFAAFDIEAVPTT